MIMVTTTTTTTTIMGIVVLLLFSGQSNSSKAIRSVSIKPPRPLKPDISTLHKQDILIL
jgi:hypothetical protein